MIGDNADIAELLVVRGVDVNARDHDGLTVADWARLITNVGIAEMLSEI
ncbi:MAG: hypothetical protein JWQ02_2124 [Capsulimonas sp.]|nr:hypothetical protein [Capsulimonas sp.]